MTAAVKIFRNGLSTLGNGFVCIGADNRFGDVTQTVKGCAVKAAIGTLFAVVVGANPVGYATAAVGYVLVKCAITLIDQKMLHEVIEGNIYRLRGRTQFGLNRNEIKFLVRIALTIAALGFKILKVGSPAYAFALSVLFKDILKEVSDTITEARFKKRFSDTLVGGMGFSAIIPGTAAYIICSKVTAVAALKIGLSASLVASMPVSLAFGATMAATTVIATVLRGGWEEANKKFRAINACQKDLRRFKNFLEETDKTSEASSRCLPSANFECMQIRAFLSLKQNEGLRELPEDSSLTSQQEFTRNLVDSTLEELAHRMSLLKIVVFLSKYN